MACCFFSCLLLFFFLTSPKNGVGRTKWRSYQPDVVQLQGRTTMTVTTPLVGCCFDKDIRAKKIQNWYYFPFPPPPTLFSSSRLLLIVCKIPDSPRNLTNVCCFQCSCSLCARFLRHFRFAVRPFSLRNQSPSSCTIDLSIISHLIFLLARLPLLLFLLKRI